MKLIVNNRDIIWKKVKSLRSEWLVPCVVYGKHMDKPLNVTCNKNDFIKLYSNVWNSQPFDIEFEDWTKEMVLIHDYQVHPVTDYLLHVDFLVLTKWEKTTAEISIDFVWESEVEKKKLGRVQVLKDTVTIEALPKDLPKNFEIDLSAIKTSNDVIFIKNLVCPDWVKILDDLEIPLVTTTSLWWEDPEEVEEEVSEDANETVEEENKD